MSASVLYWSLSIVPVQSWIAAARRSRDLRVGSTALSWLAGRTLNRLPRTEGAKILLPHLPPALLEPMDDAFAEALATRSVAIPNRASGYLPAAVAVQEVFQGLEIGLQEDWSELVDEVATSARRSAQDLWRTVGEFVEGARCPFHLVWCAEREASVDGSTAAGLERADRMLAAVKRTRPIHAHRGGPVRKCGQCGRREALGGGAEHDARRWRRTQEELAKIEEVQRGHRFDLREHLCDVCAVKRLAGYLLREEFPSTSKIAASDWLDKVRSAEDLRPVLEALEAAAGRVPGFDRPSADVAPLYYGRTVERLKATARHEDDATMLAALAALEEHHSALAGAIEHHNLHAERVVLRSEPSSYLAVLTYDGDDMARRVRDAPDILPEAVTRFPEILEPVLDSHHGEAFYLGGDEGLILVPAASATALARAVRETWESAMGEALRDRDTPVPTLSAGLVFFDRERPLGAAIEVAREALSRAKAMDDKDALAALVQTASGSTYGAVDHWGESWERVTTAVDLIGRGTLSSNWAYDVEAFLRELPEDTWERGEETRAAIRAEVHRLTRRRTPGTLGAGLEDRDTAWKELDGESWWLRQPAGAVRSSMADQLHLVAFLARQAATETVEA